MTSNIGTQEIRRSQIGFETKQEIFSYNSMREKLLEEVKKVFRPEFLNRIDEIVVFRALGRKEMEKIVELLFDELHARVQEKGVDIILDDSAKELLIEEGFDPNFGARPLKRAIEKLIEDPLSEKMLEMGFKRGTKLRIVRQEAGVDFIVETASKIHAKRE